MIFLSLQTLNEMNLNDSDSIIKLRVLSEIIEFKFRFVRFGELHYSFNLNLILFFGNFSKAERDFDSIIRRFDKQIR